MTRVAGHILTCVVPRRPFVFLPNLFPPAPHATSITVFNKSGFSSYKLNQVVTVESLVTGARHLAAPPPASQALSCHQIQII